MQNIDIFPWDDHFNTGIKAIDVQHQQLVVLLNRLATLVAYNSTKEELNAIFDELTQYTLYHFQTEEAIWHKHLAEDSLEDEHQAVHQKFVDTVLQLKEEQDNKPLSELADEALGFLARWLASHILESDRYMAYIVAALENGYELDKAKEHAKEQMNGASRILIEIILSIYSTLSNNTLRLMRELQMRTSYERKFGYQEHYSDLLLELSSSFINLSLEQIDSAIKNALGKIAQFVSADRVYIFDYDFKEETTNNTYEWCADGIIPQIDELQNVPFDMLEDWPSRHSKGEYILIEDVFAMPDGQVRDILLPQKIQSLVTFPLFQKNLCSGFIGFDAVKQKHIFTDFEITLLKLFSALLENLSDKKHNEIALSNEKGFLKTLIKAIPDLIWLKDPDGVYLSCNERFEDLYDTKEKDIVGKTDYDFVEKSLADFFRINDLNAMKNNKPTMNEEELSFASDGHKEILHTTKVPVYDTDGNLLGVLGVARDITELKRIQKELERKERYQRAVLDNFPFIVWLKDEESRFLAVNKPFADLCNSTSTDELSGKTDFDLWPKELAESYREDDAEVLASAKAKNVEELVQVEDSLRWMETYKSPVSLDGKIIGTVGFARDITEKKELEKNLITERNRFEKYLQTVESIIVSMDASGHIILINRKGCDLFGYSQEELIGKKWFEFCLPQPDGIEQIYPVFLKIMAGEMSGSEYFENSIQTKSGEVRLIAWHNTYLTDENDIIIGTLSSGEDITQRRKAEENLRLAASVFSHTREAILITSPENIIIDMNDSVERITGYSRQELIGKNPNIISSGKHTTSFYKEMWETLQKEGFWNGEIYNRRKNGDVYIEMLTISAVKNENDTIVRYVALFSDITPLKEQQKRLEYIAHYDALTGLPNRVLFSDRLGQAIVHSRRNQLSVAVIYLDLDGFKEINDTHGHDNGDKLLSIIADRMKQALRQGDTITRLGGDEFVAVLLDLQTHKDCIPFLNRLLGAASEVVHYNGLVMQVTASIGVSFFDAIDTIDSDQLLRHADQAMYQAKLLEKNRFHIFDAQQDATLKAHHEKLQTIAKALESKEFRLYYQPKVNMRSGEIVGFEALIRWKHPLEGVLSPNEFLPFIENSTLDIRVGEWVLQEAIEQIAQWKAQNLHYIVNINISAMHLLHQDFLAYIQTLLQQYSSVQTSDFILEILETSALEDISQVTKIMQKCHALGIRFALDDFGTGYSSLTYLKRLPASELKIDQSFIRDMLYDPDDLAILDGVIGLANAFRRNVIAEGVEEIKQGEFLLRLGCDVAQGYAIARPMPSDEVVEWIKTYQPKREWMNTVAMSRDDLPILYAEVEHTAWVKKVINYTQGKHSLQAQEKHLECRFGQWLHSTGEQKYQKHPNFSSIKELHQNIHQKAYELIQNKKEKSYDLDKNTKELVELHEKMLKLLESFSDVSLKPAPSNGLYLARIKY